MLLILAAAGLRPVPYTELQDALGYRSKATAAYHLGILCRRGLVERVGTLKQRIGYRIRPGVAVSCGGRVYQIVWRKSET